VWFYGEKSGMTKYRQRPTKTIEPTSGLLNLCDWWKPPYVRTGQREGGERGRGRERGRERSGVGRRDWMSKSAWKTWRLALCSTLASADTGPFPAFSARPYVVRWRSDELSAHVSDKIIMYYSPTRTRHSDTVFYALSTLYRVSCS